MNKRLHSLKTELGIDAPDFKDDTQSILNAVNNALKDEPRERTVYMKRKKFMRTTLVAALIVILGASTVFATINSNLLANFFAGDPSQLAEHVQTPSQSVTDGRYILTLEQVLMTTHQAFVLYSVEALTDDAIAELTDTCANGFSNFIGIDTISFGPVDRNDAWISGLIQREIVEKRTDTKRYFAISADIVNENEADFFIRLNVMNDPEKIIIPMATNIETRELVLGDKAVVNINPLGIVIERPYNNVHDEFTLDAIAGIFFRMSDGEIKTFSQLTQEGRAIMSVFEEYKVGEYYHHEKVALETTVLFREIMMLDRFRSIIINDTEFDFANPTKTSAFTPDEKLLHFELVPYYRDVMRVPIEELSERIGATLVWNNSADIATVTYRGSVFVIEADSTVITKNGQPIDFYIPELDESAFISDDGRLMVSARILDLMGLGVVTTNVWAEDWYANPVSEWGWIILP